MRLLFATLVLITLPCTSLANKTSADTVIVDETMYNLIVSYDVAGLRAYLKGGGDPKALVEVGKTALAFAQEMWKDQDNEIAELLEAAILGPQAVVQTRTNPLFQGVNFLLQAGSALKKKFVFVTEQPAPAEDPAPGRVFTRHEQIRMALANLEQSDGLYWRNQLVSNLAQLLQGEINEATISWDLQVLADVVDQVRPEEAWNFNPQYLLTVIARIMTMRDTGFRFGKQRWTPVYFAAQILRMLPDAIAYQANLNALDAEALGATLEQLDEMHQYNGYHGYGEVMDRLIPGHTVGILLAESLANI